MRELRLRRRWTLRTVALRAGLSLGTVQGVEAGRIASLETYVRLGDALGTKVEILFTDERLRTTSIVHQADLVHAAMGELEARKLGSYGWPVGIDEPYQHYQFAGRADLVSWDVESGALLHIENRTQFPDLQQTAGAWNAKRSYLPAALAQRLGLRRPWSSVTHVMVALWTAEVQHAIRLREATFRALCPDPTAAFTDWWSGHPPGTGTSSTLILLDPCTTGRQRLLVGLEDALRVRPRHRNYAAAAQCLRTSNPLLS